MKKEKQEERRDLTNKSRDEKGGIVREWNLGMHDPCLILTKCFVLIES